MYHKIGREYDFSIARVCDPRKDFIVGEILPFQKIRTANGRLDGRQRYLLDMFVDPHACRPPWGVALEAEALH